jgi:hypothetical protein
VPNEPEGLVQDEWLPVIEFHLPHARYAGSLDVTRLLQTLLKARPKKEAAANLLGVLDKDRDAFERAYVANELMVRGWLAAARGATQEANQLTQLAYRANAKDRWIAYALADSMFLSLTQSREHGPDERSALRKILQINPLHVEAVRALWKAERNAGDTHAGLSRARLLELSPLDREASQTGN